MNFALKAILLRFCIIFFTIVLFLFCPLQSPIAQAANQAIDQNSRVAESTSTLLPGPTDPKEVETFIDEFLDTHIPNDLSGAVFTLVKDGKVFFSKGYGYANLEQKIPVDPDKTLFRIGSLSKLLTATAIMQLVEQSKIRLDEDITKSLGPLPTENEGFKPITPHHLLTHTDGFDVGWLINSSTQCQSKFPSLEQFLMRELPARIFQPGQFFMYGDVGFALAGRLIEVVTNMPFEQYINQHLFEPMDMTNSSFQQPLPTNLANHLAVGYRYSKGQFFPTQFLCQKSVPSNSMSSSALNMANFMIAHLQQGRYNGAQVLQPETIEKMHRQHFSNFPEQFQLPGAAYGFYERHANNQRILEHGGSMYGYTSQILLLPDQKTGFFFAYNTNYLEGSIREELITKFLNHYYPVDNTNASPATTISRSISQLSNGDFKHLAKQINGRYRYIRYSRDSLAKISMITLNPKPGYRIVANPDRTITIFPGKTQWREVGPLVFQYPGSNEYITFQPDADGRVMASSLSGFVFWVYEKIAWYESGPFQIGLIICLAVIFLAAVAGWLLMELRYCQGQSTIPRSPRLIISLAGLTSALHLLFAVGLILAFKYIYYWEFVTGTPTIVIALLYLPIVAVGLTPILSCITLFSWLDKRWSKQSKIQILLVILAAWLTIPLLQYWNFLGFHYSQ